MQSCLNLQIDLLFFDCESGGEEEGEDVVVNKLVYYLLRRHQYLRLYPEFPLKDVVVEEQDQNH